MYNVQKREVSSIITLPDITGHPENHAAGIQLDSPRSQLIVVADAAATFLTNGKDISGTNMAFSYNLAHKNFNWRVNLTEVAGGRYSGYQDADLDDHGNTFVVGGYPNSIIKVSPDGRAAKLWYATDYHNHTVYGFSGIAAADKGRTLLVSDGSTGAIYRFDSSEERGHPIHIPLQGAVEPLGSSFDAVSLPKFLNSRVLLVVENNKGVIVLRSKCDGWKQAEVLGTIPNRYASQSGLSVAVLEIKSRLYVVTLWLDSQPFRKSFPLYDITSDVMALL